MIKSFSCIEDLFKLLDESGAIYLVLRNYENLLEPEFYVGGHADIDLLCDDSRKIIELEGVLPLHPKSKSIKGDGIHYCINVNGQTVSLDLREVGDGYYCEKWEKELLERRVRQDCLYVMTQEDYFYSLAYHAILQKRQFTDEYRCRLSELADRLGLPIKNATEQSFLALVENYMRDNEYVFSYSRDYMVPNRFELVDSSMIERDCSLFIQHVVFEIKVTIIELLVKIKHYLIR